MSHRSGPGSRLCWAALLALGLGACSDGSLVEVDENGNVVSRCFTHSLYLVEGDTFTFMSGGFESIDPSGRGHSSPGTGWNPMVDARAKLRTQLNGYRGWAELLWNDSVVGSFTLDRPFLTSGAVHILDYSDPDGTLVELHMYATTDCEKDWLPAVVMTRAQIEELERGDTEATDESIP